MTHPIVILHGWGLSSTVFAPLVRELRKKHIPVFAPDLPGFGDAVIPDHAFTLADYVDFVDAYIKKNHLTKPILLGHSFGGRVALQYQLMHPDRVRALILSGAPGFTPVPKRKLMLFITIAKIGRIFFLVPFFGTLRDHVRKWYYYVVGARDFYRAEGVMRDTFKEIVRQELVTAMQHVKIPTLLIWGKEDIIIPLSIAERMLKVIPHAKLVIIPGVGHNVPYKYPKQFVAALYDFLFSFT